MSEYLIVIVLGLIALGAVAFPFLVGRGRYADAAELEADVQRYRAALRAGTLCSHCREANPQDSQYCRSCGHSLG
jgi:hypothetical protein